MKYLLLVVSSTLLMLANTVSASFPSPDVWYKLENFSTGDMIANLGSMEKRTKLVTRDRVRKGGKWRFIEVRRGLYRIQNFKSRYYMANLRSMDEGSYIVQVKRPGPGALWRIKRKRNGSILLKNNDSGMFLRASSHRQNAPVIQHARKGKKARWQLIPTSGHRMSHTRGFVPEPGEYYRLTNAFLASKNKCLESNSGRRYDYLEGKAYMDRCRDTSGQYWKFEPQANGYYKVISERQGKCLESNHYDRYSGGGSFVAHCDNYSGQYWKLSDQGNGYFQLSSMYQERDGKCLEGNRVSSRSTLGGAAFMDHCQNVSGQLWTVR